MEPKPMSSVAYFAVGQSLRARETPKCMGRYLDLLLAGHEVLMTQQAAEWVIEVGGVMLYTWGLDPQNNEDDSDLTDEYYELYPWCPVYAQVVEHFEGDHAR